MFIESIDSHMQNLIENRYSPSFKVVNDNEIDTPFNTWTLKNRELAQLNAKCFNYFFYALKSNDYMHVYL